MATRDQYLEQLDVAMGTVGDLLRAGRMDVNKPFNPVMVQMAIEYGKTMALAAIAAGGVPVHGEVLEVAAGPGQPLAPVPSPEPPAAANGSGLVLPS